MVMTIGELSRQTGTTVKALRRYEGLGLICTVGRSPSNNRLFDDSACWCVGVVNSLRGLGLTVEELHDLSPLYLDQPAEPVGPHLAARLHRVRARLQVRMLELEQVRRRIEEFEANHAAELAGEPGTDPRSGA